MLRVIRESRLSKCLASFLALNLILMILSPTRLFANTSGPSQPEFNSFTPISTSDMVNLSSGDFNYNIPLMDVGGYPLNLSYDSGIKMDQEASWVGLGWNLNVGQISRDVRGLPDDFNGDIMTYENNVRDNVSVGVNADLRGAVFGADAINVGIGVGITYNNYTGLSYNKSFGPSFDLGDRVSVGMRMGTTSDGGVSLSPTLSLHEADKESDSKYLRDLSGSVGVSYDSRKGLSAINIAANHSNLYKGQKQSNKLDNKIGVGGAIKLNDYLTYTPTQDLSFNNTNLTLSLSAGAEAFGAELQGQITGWGSIQHMRNSDKVKQSLAYGYENTENDLNGFGVLDFNREKDRIVNENTKVLAPVNYTYDSYIISSQGMQGSFRPYRGQVGYVYDAKVSSGGIGGSVGAEVGVGGYAHGGLDVELNPSSSYIGRWSDSDNTILPKFKPNNNNDLDYEKVYFKSYSDLSSDEEYAGNQNDYLGYNPIKIELGSGKYNRKTQSFYRKKNYNSNGVPTYSSESIKTIKREEREDRSMSILPITNEEAKSYGQILYRNGFPGHHTAGYEIVKNDGARYIFGETAYNKEKQETTFAVGGSGNCESGLVNYSGSDNSTNNSKGRDHFYNNIKTPAYAHSYLLTSVLSTDYSDMTNNGPSPDDLGSYTKFTYRNWNSNYEWRIPIGENKATYNAGLNTDKYDQKGNYIYGRKEIKYIKKIETKTHVAFFELSKRDDGLGVYDRDGEVNNNENLYRLDRIKLYSLPDYEKAQNDASYEPTPIKTAHFEYGYELCPETPNSKSSEKGKLTLKKLYFTYKNSQLGKYNPYVFNYPVGDNELNPHYHLRGSDVWGNYKMPVQSCGVTTGETTNTEFPFVEQDKNIADISARAWALESINLPSGGVLTIEQESDDYQFVQDRKAMQMFKLEGVGNNSAPTSTSQISDKLYSGSDFKKYIYVKLPNNLPNNYQVSEFVNDLLHNDASSNGDIGTVDNMLYFRVLTNMTKNGSSNYDYVTGYVELDDAHNIDYFSLNSNHYLSLPLKFQEKEGGIINSGEQVNPISKAGWYFARKYLNRQAYGMPDAGGSVTAGSLEHMLKSLLNGIGDVMALLGGPNQVLKSKNIASTIIPSKSWVRLYEPFGRKFGGGSRVSKISLDDNWNEMVGGSNYSNNYGQEYNYLNEDGTSTGVATFEPNGSKENPFVLPVFDDPVKLIAPQGSNYFEKPIGESFYPSAQVTYSKVRVKNIEKDIVNRHATGEVVTEFYTSRDFPVTSDYTEVTAYPDNSGILGSFLKVRTRNHLAMSQGFVVHTNDMNGKMKKQRVKGEGMEEGQFISGVDYNYAINEDGSLNNNVNIIDENGEVSENPVPVGLSFDMVNDFRKTKSLSEVLGGDGNLGVIPALFGLPFPVPTYFPNYKSHEQKLKIATTTKVIHSHGLLKEKIAYDLGSKVSTENLAWDAETGSVLLTKVNNEYEEEDNYFNLNYPAKWFYENMGLAAENINLNGLIETVGTSYYRVYHPETGDLVNNISEFLKRGDELLIGSKRYWVVNIHNPNVRLMDEDGNWASFSNLSEFKIVRSGNRNLIAANMASTTWQEPNLNLSTIDIQNSNAWNTSYRDIVNASAVEYKDMWSGVCEGNFPNTGSIEYDEDNGNVISVVQGQEYNPYVVNERGNYRAEKSYAYLTGRNNGEDNYNPRHEGFFKNYVPFYSYESSAWQKNIDNWTYASEITLFNQYGAELENKDALDRFSSAVYDYYSSLPVGVASNARYEEIGVDNIEYSESPGQINQNHFSFLNAVEGSSAASIEKNTAHTGRQSIRVNPQQTLNYQLIPECVQTVNCNTTLTANEEAGIFIFDINIPQEEGTYGIEFDPRCVLDRFQIFWDGQEVADSGFTQNEDRNCSYDVNHYANQYINNSYPEIPVYTLQGVIAGVAQFNHIPGDNQAVNVTASDIDYNLDYGDGILTFNKPAGGPSTMRIVATGVDDGTIWDIERIICGEDDDDGPVIVAGQRHIYIGNDNNSNKKESEEGYLPYDKNYHTKAVIIQEEK